MNNGYITMAFALMLVAAVLVAALLPFLEKEKNTILLSDDELVGLFAGLTAFSVSGFAKEVENKTGIFPLISQLTRRLEDLVKKGRLEKKVVTTSLSSSTYNLGDEASTTTMYFLKT